MDRNTQKSEAKLKREIAATVNRPDQFVMYAYPWGRKGTILENETGPDKWQWQVLRDISHALKYGYVMNNGVRIECPNGRIWIAVRSGHGIGKSTEMGWLDHWFLSTHPNPQCITTANTENQLLYKTWRESAKWHKILINRHWFDWTATRLICRAEPTTWYSMAVPWSKTNTQAFAGTHEKYVLIKFDEASEIDDQIWEVTEGAMTEAQGLKIWIVFGNPTQNTGRFSECFKKYRNLWITYEVDSRNSKRTDKQLIEQQILTYGEDSDFVRVRIKGQEPRAGATQFIPSELAERGKGQHVHPNRYIDSPKILGIDIARFGDDRTVFIRRQGLAAYGLKKFSGLDAVQCAGLIAQEITDWRPNAVFIDMGNIGAAIYDILMKWGYGDITTGVWFSSPADDPSVYYNKRAEMGGRVKEWLEQGGCYPDDNEMRDDIVAPNKLFTTKEQLQMESAKDMKARGVASPDHLMALGLTFAYPVEPKVKNKVLGAQPRNKSATEYDMLRFNAGIKQERPRISKLDYDMLRYSR